MYLLNEALDLLFPIYCLRCLREGEYLCLACQGKIPPVPERCLVCTKPSLLGALHEGCRSVKNLLDGLLVTAPYEEQAVQNLIWHLKYNSVADIGQSLGILMGDYFWSRNLSEYFAGGFVTAVPLHKKRERFRGFNQSELLARKFASRAGLPYLALLKREKDTKDQTQLPRQERLKNIQDAFCAFPSPGLEGRKILLIDDVATTGATLNECAKVLKSRGAAEVWGFVVARN